MAVDSPKVPLKNLPGKTNWVEKYGALQPATNWIRRAAEHLQGKGMPEGRAIAVAKNAAARMCSSGDTNFPGVQQVNAGSRAQACAAVAKWDAAKARAKAARVSESLHDEPLDESLLRETARGFETPLAVARGLLRTLDDRSAPDSALRRATGTALQLVEPDGGRLTESARDPASLRDAVRRQLREELSLYEGLVLLGDQRLDDLPERGEKPRVPKGTRLQEADAKGDKSYSGDGKGGKVKCPKCGTMNSNNEAKCKNCGHDLGKARRALKKMMEAAHSGAHSRLSEATLNSKSRNQMDDSSFALPGRRYPINDLAHARNALARVAQNGSPEEQKKVRAAVYRKFPQLKKGG